MDEQYQRFEDTIGRISGGVFQCELCPIYKECAVIYGESPCCEETLFHYIMTGEKPKCEEV
jgi:hypothetical protein